MTQTSLFRSLRCGYETRVSSQPPERDHLTQRSLVDRRLKPSSVYMLHRQCLPAAGGGGGGEGLLTGSTFGGGVGTSSSDEMREDIDSSV